MPTVEIVQLLQQIHAGRQKPVELMLSAINLPVDEPGCELASSILDRRDNRHGVGPDLGRLNARWKGSYPTIDAATAAYGKALGMPGFVWKWLSLIVAALICLGFAGILNATVYFWPLTLLFAVLAGMFLAVFLAFWVHRFFVKRRRITTAWSDLLKAIEVALNSELKGRLAPPPPPGKLRYSIP